MPKRLTGVLAATAVLFVALFGRLYSLSVSSLKAASLQQSTRTQTLYTARGTVYDRYLHPLVNAHSQWAVSLYPYADVYTQEKLCLTASQREVVRAAMEQGHRASFFSDYPLPQDTSVVQEQVPIRYATESYAPHLIGYINGDGQGVCGVEQGYNDVLQMFSGEYSVSYAVDALGRPATVDVERAVNTTIRSKGGVVLTLDSHIQTIVQEVMKERMFAGAVVVSDADSGHVLATASAPTYSPNDVEKVLEQDDSPLMDRTLCLYNIGSVFKTVVAAAALEQGYGLDTTFSCNGHISVNGVEFGCRDHGDKTLLNMKEAMAVSCNSYFIQLARAVGAEAVEAMASAAQWNASLTIAKGVKTQAPSFPSVSELQSDAALANTAIGQGCMLASVFHVQSWMGAVARGGKWVKPTGYLGSVDAQGKVSQNGHEAQSITLFSDQTAKQLREMLMDVVAYGTGASAAPNEGEAYGKTGTAESGWAVNGEEVVQSWFSGCYPAKRPQYVITVLSENGGRNGKPAAPVFSTICNRLFEAGLVEISQ